MALRPDRLAQLLEEVAHERLSLRTGSPSDAEIGREKLADLAAHYIPELVQEVQSLATQLQQARAELADQAARLATLEDEAAAAKEAHKAELREVLASLYDDDLHPVASIIGNDFKAGINHERKLVAELVALKARELEVWPLSEASYSGFDAPTTAPLAGEAGAADCGRCQDCGCPLTADEVGNICDACLESEPDEDEREIIGTYEVSGLPVYEGDDYVTDVEGCYLTRAEADELAEDDRRAPQEREGKEVADV